MDIGYVILCLIGGLLSVVIPLGLIIGAIVGTVALCTWVIKRIWKGKEPPTPKTPPET